MAQLPGKFSSDIYIHGRSSTDQQHSSTPRPSTANDNDHGKSSRPSNASSAKNDLQKRSKVRSIKKFFRQSSKAKVESADSSKELEAEVGSVETKCNDDCDHVEKINGERQELKNPDLVIGANKAAVSLSTSQSWTLYMDYLNTVNSSAVSNVWHGLSHDNKLDKLKLGFPSIKGKGYVWTKPIMMGKRCRKLEDEDMFYEYDEERAAAEEEVVKQESLKDENDISSSSK